MRVRGISLAYLSMIFLLDFGTVLVVLYFSFFSSRLSKIKILPDIDENTPVSSFMGKGRFCTIS